MLDTILFGGCVAVALYLTYRICRYSKKYMEDKVVSELMYNPDLQNKVKDLFGWK